MTPDRPKPERKPLTRCGECGGSLVYPLGVQTRNNGCALVTRRCPECEVVDVVSCDAVAAIVWLRRQAEVRAQLQASLGSA
jgi:hypothetical protein